MIILENIGILILFRMLPIRFRYIYPFMRNYDLKKRLTKFYPQISLKFMEQSLPIELDRELSKIYLYKKF